MLDLSDSGLILPIRHINVGRSEFENGKMAAAQLADENLNRIETRMSEKYPSVVDQSGQFNFEQFQKLAAARDKALYNSAVSESDRISSILGFSNLNSDAQASALAAIRRQTITPEPMSIEVLTSGHQLHLGRLPAGYENISASTAAERIAAIDRALEAPADPNLVKQIQERLTKQDQPAEIARILRATDNADQSGRVFSAAPDRLRPEQMAVVNNMDPDRILVNNASLTEPYHRMAVNRHEHVHVQTNSQGFADNARQYVISSMPGESIKFPSQTEIGASYDQRFRADEIPAHLQQVATDTNSARALLARPETHQDAGALINRNFIVLNKQNDFIKISNASLDSAEAALNSGANLKFIGSLGDAKVARVPIEHADGTKYHIDFMVNKNINTVPELTASLHIQIQAARNDLANSARITAQQIEYNKALAEIHGDVIKRDGLRRRA